MNNEIWQKHLRLNSLISPINIKDAVQTVRYDREFMKDNPEITEEEFQITRRGERERFEFLKMVPLKKGFKVLDLGCGDGWLVWVLGKQGYHAEGLTFSKYGESIAKSRGLKVKYGDFHEAPYPDGTFNVVILCHVIEHSISPYILLSECRRVLMNKGYLAILSPWVNGSDIGKAHHGEAEHLFVFSPVQLKYFIGKFGFKEERSRIIEIPEKKDYSYASISVKMK